jgi:riboflavin synthase
MFTGIIKAKGCITALDRSGGDVRLSVQSADLPFEQYEVGESIAVNGVCLTAVALHDDGFDTDVSVETLDVTSLGDLHVGDHVNLEPSLAPNSRLMSRKRAL